MAINTALQFPSGNSVTTDGLQDKTHFVSYTNRRRSVMCDQDFRPSTDGDIVNESVFQDHKALVASIKTCAAQKNLTRGSWIHAEIVKRDLDIGVWSVLISMYAKCGALAEAQDVFDELPSRNVVSWNALISGYSLHGLGHEALKCFEKMQEDGFKPSPVTYSCILKACGSVGLIAKGEEIHAEVGKQGLLKENVIIGTALVDMYGKCGKNSKAQAVFDQLPVRSVISWNALISGYVQHGHGDEALVCYERMQDEGFSPDPSTYSCAMRACACIGSIEKGGVIHNEVKKQGLLDTNIVLGNTLVDMYAKCGAVAKARDVFDQLQIRNVVTWNSLISGYSQHGFPEQALNCFQEMQDAGMNPDATTFVCILKACGTLELLSKGESIHAEIRKRGLMSNNIVSNALIDMYAKCGAMSKAQDMFDALTAKDNISWNALICGYVSHGLSSEALICYEKMLSKKFVPDTVTLAAILKACGNIGSIEKGESIHAEVRKQGLVEKDIVLGTALVDMYVKCGAVTKAKDVFDGLLVRDSVAWTALIAGYAQVGEVDTAFSLFEEMISDDVPPNSVTFISLLSACSHAGLVEAGQFYFESMSAVYFLTPSLEHYTCLIDLFSRAGHFDKALALIKKIPASECLPLWSSVLGGCQKWRNVNIGRLAFENIIQLDQTSDLAYVCMGNIYGDAGMTEEAKFINMLRMKISGQKARNVK